MANLIERNYRGTITDLAYVEQLQTRMLPSLQEMAAAARNYLERTPDPERGYECKFEIGPLGIPYHNPITVQPNQYGYDPISIADTDCRMDWQYIYMRRICGISEKSAAEIGVRKRILSYLNDDGICETNPSAWTGTPMEGLWPSAWGSAHTLVSLGETYRDEPSDDVKKLARKVFDGLVRMAWQDTGRLYYPYCSPYKDGEFISEGWCETMRLNYIWIVEPMLHYYESFGDEEGLAAAISFGEGQLWDLQKDQANQRIDPITGEFEGHAHMHTRTIWGMAHLGYVTGNSRYIDWAKRAYDFVSQRATDFGWYPEMVSKETENSSSETCTVGDMTAAAYYLGLCGYTKCFDDIERTVANYLTFTQFKIDDRFEALFRNIHSEMYTQEVNASLEKLKELEGGFVAQTKINDLLTNPDTIGESGLYRNGIQMMGCCPPSGMLALYYAWLASAVKGNSGEICINTSLRSQSEYCSVDTNYSKSPITVIKINEPGEYLFKLPVWVKRDSARVTLDGKDIEYNWAGPGLAYMNIGNLENGAIVELAYDIPTFVQRQDCLNGIAVDYKLSWAGNCLLGIEPNGRYLPLVP